MHNWIFTQTPLIYFVQSIWRDEAFSYLIANKNIIDIIILSLKDFSPPLYFLLLHFWIKIFGTSEIALRSPSIIFYWMTGYVVFLILSDVFKFKLKKSLFYLFFIMINPLLIYYAFEARMYTMFTFFSLLSLYAFFKKNYQLHLISTIFGLYTHYYMIFVVICQFIISHLHQKTKYFHHYLAHFKKIAFYFFPWLILILLNKKFSSSFWLIKSQLNNLTVFLGNLFFGSETAFYSYQPMIKTINSLILIASIILLIILIYGALNYQKLVSKQNFIVIHVLIFVGILIPLSLFITSFIIPIYLSRYLIFSTITFLLLTLFIIDHLPKLIKLLVISLFIFIVFNYHQVEIKYRHKANFRKNVSEVKSLLNCGDQIFVTSELDYFVVKYYFPYNQIYIMGKSYQEIPDYVGKVLIDESSINHTLPTYPIKGYIFDSQGNYQIKSLF